nr:MAG TPA: hypothetical protein [Caudoviricetes sp.]
MSFLLPPGLIDSGNSGVLFDDKSFPYKVHTVGLKYFYQRFWIFGKLISSYSFLRTGAESGFQSNFSNNSFLSCDRMVL